MKVMLVTALVEGGVGTHVRTLAAGLAAAGHRVVVACPPSVARRLGHPADGVTYVDVPVGSRPHPARDRRAVQLLRGLMHGADVVHAHGLRAGALAVTARRVSRAPRPRLVVTTHNAPPEGRAARVVYAVLEQVVAHGADQVLCVSPDLVHRAGRAGARRPALAVVPAPTGAPVPEEAGRRAVRERVRRGLGLAADDDVPLIVNAGRLTPQKDQATLVEAVDLLTDEILADGGPAALPVLVIAGEGPARPALEARVGATHERTDVRLVGHRDDLPDLLLAADVVVSAARWEGQPVWLQEALHAGAPVVATDAGGTATVLGDAALLVDAPAGDRARALAHALGRVLRDPELREDLHRRALTRAAELPTQADAVDAALSAYEPAPA